MTNTIWNRITSKYGVTFCAFEVSVSFIANLLRIMRHYDTADKKLVMVTIEVPSNSDISNKSISPDIK